MDRQRIDLIVRHGTVVTPDTQFRADLAIAEGRFVAIAGPGSLDLPADQVYDATDLMVLPGVIDGHVHFREPGLEYKEDFGSGSRAAVMGGVTTVLEMPNTRPPTSTAELVDQKRQLAESKSHCDFGLFGLVTQDNGEQLAPMARTGVVGYKCFLGETTGNIAAPDDGMLLQVMASVAQLGLRIGFHAENDAILQHQARTLKSAGRTDPLAHVEARPAIAEVEAIQRVGLFAHHTGARIHIFHVSSRDGLEMVDQWRTRGVDVTCETGPQYCFLTSDDMRTLGARMRINPPVREPGHGDALFAGLVDGRITSIATDHSPHTFEEKLHDDIWKAISGFPGVETSLPLFLTYGVHAGRMTLSQYVRASSEGPARTWGLYPRKGAIRIGSDADLTIVDLQAAGTIDAARLHGKNNRNPYEGRHTLGAAVATIVRGEIVMRDGHLVGEPRGCLVRPMPAGLEMQPFGTGVRTISGDTP